MGKLHYIELYEKAEANNFEGMTAEQIEGLKQKAIQELKKFPEKSSEFYEDLQKKGKDNLLE